MDKKEFLKLDWDKRAEYLNERIKELGTYEKACKELGISISQTGTLKKHGWVLSEGTFIHDENLDKGINNSTARVENIDNNILGQETLFDKTDKLQSHQDNVKNMDEIQEHTSSINQSKHSSENNNIIENTGFSRYSLNYKTVTSLQNELDSVEPINMEREDSKSSEEVDIPLNNKDDDLTYIESNSKQVIEKIGHILTSDTDESAHKVITPKEDEVHENNTRLSLNDIDSENIVKKVGRPSKPGRKKYSLNLDIANFKQLQIHCIINDKNPSDVVNELIENFLKKG